MATPAAPSVLKAIAVSIALLSVPTVPALAAVCGRQAAASGAVVPLDVFLIAGQSNATGLPDDAAGSPQAPADRVLQYYRGRITVANDPVGNAEPGSAWPQFGITYTALTGHRVLFVPASMPASSMTRAGDFLGKGHWDATGGLFQAATEMADDALKAAGPGARFAGVLWDQGEADALAINIKFETAADYKSALEDLIARFREHFGPDTPFFIFETGATGDPNQGGMASVRLVQREISEQGKATPIVFKDAESFLSRNLMAKNKVHYSQAGYNFMGLEGAQGVAAFYKLNAKPPCTP